MATADQIDSLQHVFGKVINDLSNALISVQCLVEIPATTQQLSEQISAFKEELHQLSAAQRVLQFTVDRLRRQITAKPPRCSVALVDCQTDSNPIRNFFT